MASGQGGKREEIRGTTSRDILNINNNFKWLWNYVFGNINFTDINASVINKLSALQNSVNGFLNLLNNHKDNSTIHTNTDEKNYWNGHVGDVNCHVTIGDKNNWNSHENDNNIHVSSSDKDGWNSHKNDSNIHVTTTDKNNWNSKVGISNSVLSNSTNITGSCECIKIGSLITLNGSLKNNTGSAFTTEVTIATIPTGYRPVTSINLSVRTSLGLAKLNVYSTGEVKIDLTSSAGYISSLANLGDIFLYSITFKGA